LTHRANAGTLFVSGPSSALFRGKTPYDAGSASLSPDVVRQSRFERADAMHPLERHLARGRPGKWDLPLPLFAWPSARFGIALAAFLLFGQVAMHACLPLAAKSAIVRNVRRVKGLVVLQEMDKDPVGLVGGMDGGLDLTLAALDGVKEGMAKVGAVQGEMVAQEIKRVAEEGIALLGHLAVDDGVAGDVDSGRHTGLSPELVGKEDIIDIAHAGQITGDKVRAGAGDSEQVTRGGGGEKGGQGIDGLLVLSSEELVMLKVALQEGGKGRGNVGRREKGTADDGEDLVGGFGAAAIAVLVKEIDDGLAAEGEDVVRIGAEGDQRLDHLPFEGTGGQR
jgi:hypothetical protein